MKTLVLDATELCKDFMLSGLKYQLLQHTAHLTWISVCLPVSVLEETVANFARAQNAANQSLERANRDRRRVGRPEITAIEDAFVYREYLNDRLDATLGVTVLDWPTASHADLVRRAVSRMPPFDAKGGGYRDSLVWASVLELVRDGQHVALATEDRTFFGPDGNLASELVAEVEGLAGSVELVRNLADWLIDQLPWVSDDLAAAVERSRVSQFYDYYLQSDLQEYLVPEAESLGFQAAPLRFEVLDVHWGGDLVPKGSASSSPDGLVLVEYELDQLVEFEAEFRAGAPVDEGWHVSAPDALGYVRASGETMMIVRIGVLYGGDFEFSVDQLSWRRADGIGPGSGKFHVPQEQTPLFHSSS